MNNKSPLDARYPDLLEGQDDPALLDLVHDLDALYTTTHIPAQLIHSQENQPLHLVASQHAQGPQSGTFPSPASKPARRWSRLNALAAVLFTFLLVGALAGIFYTFHHRTTPAHPGPTPTLGITPTLRVTPTPTPGVVLGPQACPAQVAAPAYWEPIISPYAYGGPHHVELVSCANLMGTLSLQALVTVRRGDDGRTLDVFVFSNITDAHPTKVFQVMGLVQGDAKISDYNTVMTAQADELSSLNTGKTVSAMTADLFREFKWSERVGTLVQTVFPGMFPDITRYQAEADQVQVNGGHQPWKLSATQVATALAVSLLNWSPNSTPTLLSGGGPHDVSAVVRVRSTELVGGSINVTLSRLEGNTNGGIWEVVSVTDSGLSITSPAPFSQISSPVQVTGTGSAFEGVIGRVIVLDHLYQPLGQAQATGAIGMGPTSFSSALDYQSTFPAGTQEGILLLSITSNANGSIAAAVMEKVLIKGLSGGL
jgi:hypothetical protein